MQTIAWSLLIAEGPERRNQGSADEQRAAALEEAKEWDPRRVEADGEDANAWYYLGVVDWTEAFPAMQASGKKAAMRSDQPGPLPAVSDRKDLKTKYGERIEHGLRSLEKCLEFGNDKEDAMAYMNLLLHEKALIEDSANATKSDRERPEDWTKEVVELRQRKAVGPPQR